MQLHVRLERILFLFMILTGVTGSGISQATTPQITRCAPNSRSVSIDAPIIGFANIQTISVDEQCRVTTGPIQTMSIHQLPVFTDHLRSQHSDFRPISGLESKDSRYILRTLRSAQYVLDPLNIILNDVHGDVSFSYDGSKVISYWSSGGTRSHTEPISCGVGWSARNLKNTVHSIGPNNSSVKFKHQASFSYKGEFDCSGTLFDNKVKNFPTIYGTGSGSCTFEIIFLTGIESALWHYVTVCYLLP